MKLNDFIRKLHQASVFTKLLFIMIVTCIIVIITIVGFIKYYSIQVIPTFKENAFNYVKYIVQEIGTPPDTHKAQQIAREFSIQIRFETPSFRWKTNGRIISFKEFASITSDKNTQIKTGFDEGIYYVSLNHASGRYLFAFDLSNKGSAYWKAMAILLLILLVLIFSAAYSLIRRLLKPIKWLAKGVEKISDGDLKYQVRVQRWRED
ncbi:MAG: hypothetical protein KAT17_07740, partial [Candidatus Aminicenantes bacterium]|nr:hypothetical protein [Candidatus Aminicenantes bacterium]